MDLRPDLETLAIGEQIEDLKRSDARWRENILEYMQAGKVLPVNVQEWARKVESSA